MLCHTIEFEIPKVGKLLNGSKALLLLAEIQPVDLFIHWIKRSMSVVTLIQLAVQVSQCKRVVAFQSLWRDAEALLDILVNMPDLQKVYKDFI